MIKINRLHKCLYIGVTGIFRIHLHWHRLSAALTVIVFKKVILEVSFTRLFIGFRMPPRYWVVIKQKKHMIFSERERMGGVRRLTIFPGVIMSIRPNFKADRNV